eukprot:10775623-Lingulodinium_polyedra.AAC.1
MAHGALASAKALRSDPSRASLATWVGLSTSPASCRRRSAAISCRRWRMRAGRRRGHASAGGRAVRAPAAGCTRTTTYCSTVLLAARLA